MSVVTVRRHVKIETDRGSAGPVFTNHSQEYSLSFYPRFVNLNVTQLLIG